MAVLLVENGVRIHFRALLTDDHVLDQNLTERCKTCYVMTLQQYHYENIDCGYTLEPPRYTPAYSSFTVCNWGIREYSLHGPVFLILTESFRLNKIAFFDKVHYLLFCIKITCP